MSDAQLTTLMAAAFLSENFILVTCIGIGTRPQAFLDPADGRRTGLCLTLVMVVTTVISRWIDLFLSGHQLEYLNLLAFTLLVFAATAVLRKAIALFLPALSARVDGCMASLATNAGALGAVLLASQRGYSSSQAFVFALFGGLGATLVMTNIAGLREEVSFDRCPKAFRGLPILFITAGLMALTLVGYYGLNFE